MTEFRVIYYKLTSSVTASPQGRFGGDALSSSSSSSLADGTGLVTQANFGSPSLRQFIADKRHLAWPWMPLRSGESRASLMAYSYIVLPAAHIHARQPTPRYNAHPMCMLRHFTSFLILKMTYKLMQKHVEVYIWQELNTLAATYEISHTLSVCLVVTYELTCTSHNGGQWLPSVHINYNAAY